jgi:hypothetical protein
VIQKNRCCRSNILFFLVDNPVHKWITHSGYCGVNKLLHNIWELPTELSTGIVDNSPIFVEKIVDKWKT